MFRQYALIAAIVAATVTILPGQPLRAQRATLDRILHTQTLENGLQVIVIENHAIPLTTAEIVFRAGAMTQEAPDQGVPHLFEHMLFKSYRGMGGIPFGWEAAKVHASYNGETSDEAVSYYLTLPSSNTDDALGILARLVRDAEFQNNDFQKERFVVLGELQRDASDPHFQLSHEIDTRLWGPSFVQKNVIGDVTSLLAVTTSQLQAIFERYYVPNNAALIITGDVAPAQVLQMVRKHFAGWKRGADPFVAHPVPAIAHLDSTRAVVVADSVNTISIEVQWQGPSVADDPRGTYAADVLSDLLRDERSQFHERLIDSGMFQHADIAYTTRAHVGPIVFRGITTPANLAGALTALDFELELMRDSTYFTREAIAVATKQRAVGSVFELENTHALARSLAETWAVAGTDYFRGYVDGMSACTTADLHAFVTRYLGKKPYVIGALAPAARATETSHVIGEFISMAAQ